MTLDQSHTESRARRIGSTDSSAVMGLYHPSMLALSKKKNATDVWLRLVHAVDLPGSGVMRRGTSVEPLIRQLYRDTVQWVDDPPPRAIQHPDYDWMCGSPDGVVADVLVEFKTVGKWVAKKWGKPGTDQVPQDYMIQVQHLMEVTKTSVAHVLAAFGEDVEDEYGPRFDISGTGIYSVKYDKDLVNEIVRCGQKFMNEHVRPGISPLAKPVSNIRKWQALLKEQHNQGAQNE